jgi:CubicO group peptidase (beta-lactamase class C family)
VIERISGVPYDQYVAERVLRPLGIDISLATIPTPAMVERMALPYDVENGVSTPIEQVRFDVYAAGDAYLRPTDMAKFFAAHLGGGSYAGQRILNEASIIEMHRQQFESGRNGLGIDPLPN